VAELSGVGSGRRDPRERWRRLPVRVRPEAWVAEQAVVAVPGAVAALESQLQTTEARYVIERGCGLF
jgi:hypothetical protein